MSGASFGTASTLLRPWERPIFNRIKSCNAVVLCPKGDVTVLPAGTLECAGDLVAHDRTPNRNRMIPAAQDPASVGIIPTLNRKIATAAATESASAHGSTLASFGASKASRKARTGSVSRKTVWIANQIARFSTTPTTAAVIADRAPLSALLPRRTSMKGAPKNIQRKHGVNVTHVASRPPSVPASIGGSAPGSRKAAMKP